MSYCSHRLTRHIVCVHIFWLPGRKRRNYRAMSKSWEFVLLLYSWSSARDSPNDQFTNDLQTGVIRTEIFHVHLSTFETAVDIALNAEFSFKVARYGTQWDTSSLVDKAESMISSILERKLSFKQLSSNVTSEELHVRKHEAPSPYLSVATATPASTELWSYLKSENPHGRGKRQLLVCARFYWISTKLCRTSRR